MPLVSGLVGLAGVICVVVFWPSSSGGGFYWIRSAIGGALAWFGIWQLKVAIFGTEKQIWRAAAGDVKVWKETAVAAPSIFRIKDVIFVLAVLVLLLLVIIVVSWVGVRN